MTLPAVQLEPCRNASGELLPAVAVATPVAAGRTGLYKFSLCLLPAVQRAGSGEGDCCRPCRASCCQVRSPSAGRCSPNCGGPLLRNSTTSSEGCGSASPTRRGGCSEAIHVLNGSGDDQISVAEILSAQMAFGDGSVKPLFGPGGLFSKFDVGHIMRFDTANESLDATRVSSFFDVFVEDDD